MIQEPQEVAVWPWRSSLESERGWKMSKTNKLSHAIWQMIFFIIINVLQGEWGHPQLPHKNVYCMGPCWFWIQTRRPPPPWTPLYEALQNERGFNEYIHYIRFPADLSGHFLWADFQNKYEVSVPLSGSTSPESIKFCLRELRMVPSDLCLYKDALIDSVLFTSST